MVLFSVFDLSAIRSEFSDAGISPQFIPSIWKYVLQNPNSQAHSTPYLPSAAYPLLSSNFRSMTSTLASSVESKDGTTTKLLIKLQNGSFVEAVIMKYDPRLGIYDGKPRKGGQRSTLCISSQVGCKMACKFCATGSMGFKSNLSTGEIVEQLVHASYISHIRNVVFMGMGEPLNNYASVVEAIQIMTGVPFLLSPKRITISSVGVIHNINKLSDDLPKVNLAISLHAPTHDLRCKIIPSARAFPLTKLIDALKVYQTKSLQKVFIEYIMLKGVNDTEEHAHHLGKLLEMIQVINKEKNTQKLRSIPVVNLIPFNPIGSLSTFTTSTELCTLRFQKILRSIYNIHTTIRQQMGQDINGACGQLVTNHLADGSVDEVNLVTDIEDLHL